MARTKRLSSAVVSKTGVTVDKIYCRKCMKIKPSGEYFVAVDLFLDANGFMSICKPCISDLYKAIYAEEGIVERAVLRMCRILNIRYSEQAIEAAKKHIDGVNASGRNIEDFFGMYKQKIGVLQKVRLGEQDVMEDLTFVEPSKDIKDKIGYASIDDQEYYDNSWGRGLSPDDYYFLEQEFAKWKRTTKCDSQGEEILVRELCHKQNDIRKARLEGKNVDSLVKSLQEIMKNSALTPALQSAANAGKNAETFGVWIKEIEQNTPAEWYQDKLKYKDIDGIDEYNQKYITRPLQNFVTGSRDFNTGDLEEINDIDDVDLGTSPSEEE
jgi:hypothetical protein